jgi:hypothetical protein
MLDRPARLGSTWVYLSGEAGRVTRVQDPERRSPFMVPPGRGSLQLEIPASAGEPLWEIDDATLMRRAWEEIGRAGVRPRAEVLGSFSTRQPCAYPVAELNTRGELARGIAAVHGARNLEVCGRQGRFSYIFSDRAMEEGIAAARRWLGIPTGLPAPEAAVRCPTEATSLLG